MALLPQGACEKPALNPWRGNQSTLNIISACAQLIDCSWAAPAAAQHSFLSAVTRTLQVSGHAQKACLHPGALLPTWVCAPPFGLLLSFWAHHWPSVQVCEISAPGTNNQSQSLAHTTVCTALQTGGKGHLALVLFPRLHASSAAVLWQSKVLLQGQACWDVNPQIPEGPMMQTQGHSCTCPLAHRGLLVQELTGFSQD